MMQQQWSSEDIKSMWSERAQRVDCDSQVTHRDVYQRHLEIARISAQLRPENVVLDVGCGNGWATVRLAQACSRIVGMDYSEEMIERACQEHAHVTNAVWRVGNVLSLTDEEQYDAVTTMRCLINITDIREQQQAITNLHRATKEGGRLLMLEGVADGRTELSRIRADVGLAPLPNVPHNLDFGMNETMKFLKELFSNVTFESNGIYDLVTRVLYPCLIAPAEPEFNTAFHSTAATLAATVNACPEISRFGLFTCTK